MKKQKANVINSIAIMFEYRAKRTFQIYGDRPIVWLYLFAAEEIRWELK